jgi:hypothetical protein
MTEICIIGNSHLASLKMGWDIIKDDFRRINPTFFAAPGKTMENLAVSDNALVGTTDKLSRSLARLSGGKSQIDDVYDRYLVCGLKFSVSALVLLLRDYRIETEPKDGRQPLSDECFRNVIEGCLRQTLCIETIQKLRLITRAPIGLIPVPYRNDSSSWSYAKFVRCDDTWRCLARDFVLACENLAKAMRFKVFFQPESTISEALRTKSIYSEGSVQLENMAKRHEAREPNHMNALYGGVVLRSVFSDTAWIDGPRAAVLAGAYNTAAG